MVLVESVSMPFPLRFQHVVRLLVLEQAALLALVMVFQEVHAQQLGLAIQLQM